MATDKFSVLKNMAWRFAERIAAQGVSFCVSIVLARLLLPEEYGVVSLITIITSVLTIFVDSGFNLALIQKKDADQLDFSTVFFFNIFMGLLLYGLMFLLSPFIADFYGKAYMIPYIRVLSLTLVLGGINSVQHAIVSKRMQFRRFFFSTLIGTVLSAIVGIYMAWQGFGVWALIVQRLLNQAIDTTVLWFTVRWRPSFAFSVNRLKPLFRFGSRILLSSVMSTFSTKLLNLLIGKVYSAEELAYYEKGDHLPALLQTNLQISVQSVLMPVLSNEQSSQEAIQRILKKSIIVSSYIMFPCLIGLTVCAGPLIRILYTEKWAAMIPYMQLICITYMPWLLHTANLQVIQATGNSSVYLKIEIIKQFLSLTLTIVFFRFGIKILLSVYAFYSGVCFIINALPNRKICEYGPEKQIRAILPSLILSLVMGLVVWGISFLGLTDASLLLVQVFVGANIYFTGSVIFRLEGYFFIKEVFLKALQKMK